MNSMSDKSKTAIRGVESKLLALLRVRENIYLRESRYKFNFFFYIKYTIYTREIRKTIVELAHLQCAPFLSRVYDARILSTHSHLGPLYARARARASAANLFGSRHRFHRFRYGINGAGAERRRARGSIRALTIADDLPTYLPIYPRYLARALL